MTTMLQRVLSMIALSAASASAIAGEQAEPSTHPRTALGKQTGYAAVNGLNMYYQIAGAGRPAVFIHSVVGHSGLVPS